ncbi:MAG: hypothetical protein HC886_21970 [Leptolyngbyaceae cyanobacterium SM1_1_3]|nr:hypothetical protein [Leptolyngbyaceae cyanobacterium SM1_1_3]
MKFFFNRLPPQVVISIDTPLTQPAHLSLAQAYTAISQHFPALERPPNVLIRGRKTTLTFHLQHNDHLFIIAYLAALPFQDCPAVKKNVSSPHSSS